MCGCSVGCQQKLLPFCKIWGLDVKWQGLHEVLGIYINAEGKS
jgi:hypothetical protein